MKIKSILAGSVALAAVALVGPPVVPNGHMIPSAEAAISVSINIFFDGLAPYGDWVFYRDRYVFIPARVGRDWRPYTEGHWVYASDYGWTWISDEPFGWATYHYGRWGYSDDIGWYWVPGKRWAPAWVSWRRSKDYVVWAPLPPSWDDEEVTMSISIGDIPDDYWVAVPTVNFIDVDLDVVIIHEDSDRRRIIQEAEPVGSVTVENNIVVNNVIEVTYIEKETGKDVHEVEVQKTDDPRKAESNETQVTVYEGTVETDKEAKPPKVTEVEELKKSKRDQGETDQTKETTDDQPAAGESGDQAAQPENKEEMKGTTDQLSADEDQSTQSEKKKKIKQTEDDPSEAVQQSGEESTQPEKKKKIQQTEDDPSEAIQESSEETTQPAKKKKVKETKEEPFEVEQQASGEESAQPEKKKKAKQSEEQSTEEQSTEEQSTEEQSTEDASRQNTEELSCDPNQNPDCAAQ